MKKSLTINATRDGKKVSKSFGYVNPDVANSIVGGFAQLVNALSNDTFVNAEVVKKMDTTEEEQGGGSTPTTAKQEGIIAFDDDPYERTVTVNYNGDANVIYCFNSQRPYTGDTSPATFVTISSGSSYWQEEFSTTMFVAPATDNFTAAVAFAHYED